MAETTFYSTGTVVVTNARAVMAGKTYALANVTSVRKAKIPVNYGPAAGLIVIGFLLAGCGFGSVNSPVIGVLGVLMIAGGIALAVAVKPSYAVVLGSSGGETSTITDRNEAEIDRVVDAISNAIIHRG